MARPYKQGLIYFPLDIDYYEDEKIVELSLEYGPVGEAVFLRLLSLIYAGGYFIERSVASVARTILRTIGQRWVTSSEMIEDVIRMCGRLDLIDERLLESGVFTSKAIQRQFLLSTKRRKQIDTSSYWLLDDDDNRVIADNNDNNPVIDDKNPENEEETGVNVDESTQSKSNSNKDLLDKLLDKSARGAPVLHYLTKCLIEAKYMSQYSLDLDKYDQLFESLIEDYGFENVRTVTRYISKRASINSADIDDRFGYFKVSALNNLDTYLNRKGNAHESFEDWVKRRILQVDR